MSDYKIGLGKRIKILRGERNISQDELAKKIGVHTNHLSRYERDLTSPSIDVVIKMAEALGVSIDFLIFGDMKPSLNDKDLVSLFNKIELLTDRQKETVKDFLSAFVLKADLTQKLAK
ncbi:helix-turn-helix transcriptional regulator [Tenacibaculum maritimum]|uniref:helix-turn-helix domain-containing protein n=1 Tax=Tenacibaculum maritimum TaxID=107401 RepID=UPI0012E4A589|nr:helix-turn-helix transcriptional regulator [Tenacibaculum maritimum]CAA0230171.1 putative transcriptional regulator [Tenacibaculum maritimum]CAA0237968.1 Helix-turn-helix protein [Tenacibaculum maritimum]